VLSHADDDEGRRRGVGHQLVQRPDAIGSEDRLVDDDHRRRDARQQPAQVLEAGDLGQRLDAGLALQHRPQRSADAPVRGGEEDGDRACDGRGLCRHVLAKHPVTEAGTHPGGWRNRPP
jgi:hypothetical protein